MSVLCKLHNEKETKTLLNGQHLVQPNKSDSSHNVKALLANKGQPLSAYRAVLIPVQWLVKLLLLLLVVNERSPRMLYGVGTSGNRCQSQRNAKHFRAASEWHLRTKVQVVSELSSTGSWFSGRTGFTECYGEHAFGERTGWKKPGLRAQVPMPGVVNVERGPFFMGFQ